MFQAFINDISNDFVPSLLGKQTVDCLLERVTKHSTSVFCIDGNELIAMAETILFEESSNVYIKLLGVDRKHRNMGIATKLILKTIAETKSLGMKKVSVHTNNKYALQLYQNIGFKTQFITLLEDMQEPYTHRHYLEYIVTPAKS